MFNKSLDSLTYDDILRFINTHRTDEKQNYDYKRCLKQKTDELAKDCSAFANSGGGYLIIGYDEKSREISGTPFYFGKQIVSEWISNVLTANVMPRIKFDIKLIPFDGQNDHGFLIIKIPDSKHLPHMAMPKKRYYVRYYNKIEAATHYELRNMFAFSARSSDSLNNFLKENHLLNQRDKQFGINDFSAQLIHPDYTIYPPFVLFSLIPVMPEVSIFEGSTQERLLILKNMTKQLDAKQSLYETYKATNFVVVDNTLIFQHKRSENKEDGLLNYFKVSGNGYIETACSAAFFHLGNNQSNLIDLNYITGFCRQLLNFARTFYLNLNWYDMLHFQISLVGIKGFRPSGFHRIHQLKEADLDKYRNDYDRNMKIVFSFKPGELINTSLEDILLSISERLCKCFGIDENLIYNNKQQFDEVHFSQFVMP